MLFVGSAFFVLVLAFALRALSTLEPAALPSIPDNASLLIAAFIGQEPIAAKLFGVFFLACLFSLQLLLFGRAEDFFALD